MKMPLFAKLFTFVLLASFIGLAVFGFAAMTHADGHDPNGCIAAASRETDCSKASGPLAMFNLHIDALKSFSALTLSSSYLQALLLFAVSLIFFLSFKIFSPSNFAYFPFSGVSIFNVSPKSNSNFSNWFSLHENSPTNG